jgi:hypothetical protein
MWSSDVPSRVADVDVKGLGDQEFDCRVWRDGECLRGAGGGEGMGEAEAAAGCRCVCLCLTLLLLQLMCTMPSTSQSPCTPGSRDGPHTRTSSPWTLKPDACRISKTAIASSSAATHHKCSLCKSRVCRVRSSGRSRRSRCVVMRGKCNRIKAQTCNRWLPPPQTSPRLSPQQPQALLTRFAALCQSHPVSCVERGSRLPRLRTPNHARALLAAAAGFA